MKRGKTEFYLIRRSVLDELPSEAVLDMLRYDGSRVENNRPDGFWLFSFDPTTNPRTPVIERWRSFGVPAEAILGPFKDAFEAHDAARKVPA